MHFPAPDLIDRRPAKHLDWFMRNLKKQFVRHAVHGKHKQVIGFDSRSIQSNGWNKYTNGFQFLLDASEQHKGILVEEANMMLAGTGWQVTKISACENARHISPSLYVYMAYVA